MNKKLIAIPVVLVMIIVATFTAMIIINNNKRTPVPIYALEMTALTGYQVTKEYDDGITNIYYLSNGKCDISVWYPSNSDFIKSLSFDGQDKGNAYSSECIKAFGNILREPTVIDVSNETDNMVTDLASSLVTRNANDLDKVDMKDKIRFIFLDKMYTGGKSIDYNLKITRDYNIVKKSAENFKITLQFEERSNE